MSNPHPSRQGNPAEISDLEAMIRVKECPNGRYAGKCRDFQKWWKYDPDSYLKAIHRLQKEKAELDLLKAQTEAAARGEAESDATATPVVDEGTDRCVAMCDELLKKLTSKYA